MAKQILADIDLNSTLLDVIRKCNYNFRIISANQLRKSRSDIRQMTGEITVDLSNLADALSDEVSDRLDGDRDLSAAVDEVLQYTHMSDWDIDATAATTATVDCSGYHDLIVSAQGEPGNPLYIPLQLVPTTAHQYEANGKQVSLSKANDTLTVSVPAGDWQFWVR